VYYDTVYISLFFIPNNELISTYQLQKRFMICTCRRTPGTPYETTILVRDSCLCLHVQGAARALARHFDNALRLLGLTNGQFSLMMSLNRSETPTIRAVASLPAMDRTTLTAAL
jgi:hypothetical protein